MSVFLDRHRELSALADRYRSGKAEFVVLYGRRRVGKSDLIDQFLQFGNGIHLLAREESKTLQLRKFSRDLGNYFEDPFLKRTGFSDWDSFFEYIVQRSGSRFVLAIDEFPYLVKEDPSLPSIIQDYWDTHLKETQVFLLLSGSSISMMESTTMDYRSPLFGRRTGQILLHPLRFIHVLDYLGDMRKAVEFYAVFGGTPAYIMTADPDKDIMANVEEKLLREDSFLFRDVEFVLRTELAEPRYYFSILYSIAEGNNRIGLICNDTGLSKSIVNKYLSVLIDLQLVHRRIPVTEGQKSRKGLYFLSDNLFNFWFSFANPCLESLERGNAGLIADQYVKPRFAAYVGRLFEAIVADLFELFNQHGALPFVYTRLGSWWHRGEEIDIVCLREDQPEILFCECKWQDGVDGHRVLEELRAKAPHVSWQNGRRKEHFCIVARTFSRRPMEDDRVSCYDLDDLTRVVADCRKGGFSA
ncbi:MULTISPECIES: ATP-binding protein [unclassified Methanoculleus]|uniref:ATP-binding protein n=1 Tax=unclassified Methanoculleus TaxID=2619537 RepID=UPI0025E10D0C|nr:MULTISPECIES: ATP-binding protein [unclassified Methanoculleus]